jgi:RNA polymerase sigma factor (sigma-70 family)
MQSPAEVAGRPDPVLWPFLEAEDPAAAHELSELASSVISPLALRVCRARLRGNDAQDAEDVAAGAVLAVLGRLRALRQMESAPIEDFRAYVAGAAANACRDHARLRHPERFKLKSRIRYVLQHQPGLASWTHGPLTVGGYAAWKGRSTFGVDLAAVAALGTASGTALLDVLSGVFDAAGAPMELDALVDVVARRLGIEDARLVEMDAHESRSAPEPDPAARIDDQAALRRLWAEIAALPLRQRTALLLNLRDADGHDAIDLFPVSGTVAIDEIAAVLGLTPGQFASLRPRLPLPDAEIAALLGLERQQVINLRKCARERLARRLSALR